MSRGNNRRPRARAPLLGCPPSGYEENKALSRASNTVHTMIRLVSDLRASMDTEKADMLSRLHEQELAYERMVCEYTSMVSDQKLQNQQLIEQNRCLVLKLTETEEQLAVNTAELKASHDTCQKHRALDDQQRSTASEVTQLLSENNHLQEKLQQQQANNTKLEAENVQLIKETEAVREILRLNKSDLVLEITETAEHLALKNAELEVHNDTLLQDLVDLEERTTSELICQQQCLESKVTALDTNNICLALELQQHQANEELLEAENIMLKNERIPCLISMIHQLENLMAIKAQEFQVEITLLENICLYSKKKRLGTFGRRMEDRKTEMDKMRQKMQDME